MSENKSTGAVIGSILGTLVLAAACGTAGWIACEMWPKGQKGGAQQMPVLPAVSVAVRPVEMRAYNLPNRYVAHAEAVQEVDLLPQIDGYVKEIKFKEGDLVKAGDVLYLIDDERYQAVVNQRKADLAASEAEARRAERYWERMQKADARGITEKERDDAQAGAEKSKAAVLQAKANLVVAEYDLNKTLVKAPITGQIGKSSAYPGDYVAPSKGALARIVQVDPIRVSFPLTDREYVQWRMGQTKGTTPEMRMRLILPDGTEYNRPGTWAYDDNQMSLETATIMMRLSFPNAERLLVPNSYVTLLTDYRKPPKVPCVPQQAVIDLTGGSQGVYVLKEDMTVEQRVVKVKEMHEGWIPVLEGVKEGEKVVISGMSKLVAGAKVTLMQPTSNDDIDPKYDPAVKE